MQPVDGGDKRTAIAPRRDNMWGILTVISQPQRVLVSMGKNGALFFDPEALARSK